MYQPPVACWNFFLLLFVKAFDLWIAAGMLKYCSQGFYKTACFKTLYRSHMLSFSMTYLDSVLLSLWYKWSLTARGWKKGWINESVRCFEWIYVLSSMNPVTSRGAVHIRWSKTWMAASKCGISAGVISLLKLLSMEILEQSRDA